MSINYDAVDVSDSTKGNQGQPTDLFKLSDLESAPSTSNEQDTKSLVNSGVLNDLSLTEGDSTGVEPSRLPPADHITYATGNDNLFGLSQGTGTLERQEATELQTGRVELTQVVDNGDQAVGEKPVSDAQMDAAKAHTYRGTDVSTAVDAEQYTVQKGDNPWTIARNHLGESASEMDVLRHVQEIMKENNISNDKGLQENQVLMLPGHTEDGGYQTADENGNKTTYGKDGSVRVDNKDGSGRKQSGEGNDVSWKDQAERQTLDQARERQTVDGGETSSVTDAQIQEALSDQGKGMEINRDVDPDTHTVEEGDNLWKIAKKHLGEGASDNEIWRHTQEIARLNDISNPDLIKPGQELRIPGHDTEGNTITEDESGNRTTYGKDGSVRIDNKDGSGYERKADGTEKRWDKPGTNTDQNGNQNGDQNGDQNSTDGTNTDGTDGADTDGTDGTDDPDIPDDGSDNGNDGSDHQGLVQNSKEQAIRDAMEAAKLSMGEDSAEYRQFAQDAEQFARRTDIPEAEITKSFREVERLLEADDAKVPQGDRNLLAQNFMHHAKDPKNIDQGGYKTCNATTMQERLFSNDPSIAAEMLATTAIDGKWTAPDGKEISIDPASLVPMPESRLSPPLDNSRSFATQVLNNVLINDIQQRRTPPQYYAQLSMNPDGSPLATGDNGERLYDASGNEVTKSDGTTPYRAPGVFSGEMAQGMERLTGDKGTVISNPESDGNANLTHVRSVEELGRTLQDMQENGKLPAIILVDSDNPAFGGSGDGTPGWHVVSVRNYDPATGKVEISNQWGQASDREMTLDNLFESTRDHSKPRTRGATRGFENTSDVIKKDETRKKNFDWNDPNSNAYKNIVPY